MIIRVHVSEIRNLDPNDKRLIKTTVPAAKMKKQLPGEEALLGAGLRLFSKLDQPSSKYIGACLDFQQDPASAIQTVGTMKHIKTPPSSGNCIATGPAGSAGLGGSIGASGGVFFSNGSPGLGLYGSIDLGLVTNATASVVWQFMGFKKTAKQVFASGRQVVMIGVNLSATGTFVTGGGFIACYMTPGITVPSFELIGLGFQIGAGVSGLPVEVFITSAAFSVHTI